MFALLHIYVFFESFKIILAELDLLSLLIKEIVKFYVRISAEVLKQKMRPLKITKYNSFIGMSVAFPLLFLKFLH